MTIRCFFGKDVKNVEDNTRVYDPVPEAPEEEAFELDEVLEPYAPMDEPEYVHYQDKAAYAGESSGEYADEYPQEEYYEPYDEADYSDDHEALDREGKVRAAMGVFNSISILAGVVIILILLAMLVSLGSWLRRDILHSLALLQGGIQ